MKKDKMKKKMMGYKAGGLQMVEKDGKKVPFYAADGKGKMMMGGKVMGYRHGGAHLTTSSTTARSGPTPNAEGLKREAEVSNELDADMAAFKKRAAARKAKKAGKKMMSGGKVMGYKEGDMVKAAKEKVKKGKTKRLQFGGGPKGDKGFGSELPRLLGFDYDGAGISDEDMAKNSADLKKAQKQKQKQKKMAGGMMKKKMMGGGKVMGYKHGGKTSMPRGCGVATRQRPAKMVVMKGS